MPASGLAAPPVAMPDDEPMPSGGKQRWGFELDMPFYTWASVIVNGRVVATDYAPDAGWLVATRGAKPGGTFLLGDPFPHLSMTVPDGWHTGGRGDLTQDDRPASESWKAGLSFVIVDKDAGEACTEPGTIEPLLGPGFDDLVTFLAGLPSIDISENEDVTLDGYRGTYLEFNQKGGTEQACALVTNSRRDLTTAYPLWDGEGYHQVWILDVDGVRLVIDAFSLAPSETVKSELRADGGVDPLRTLTRHRSRRHSSKRAYRSPTSSTLYERCARATALAGRRSVDTPNRKPKVYSSMSGMTGASRL